MWLLATSLFFVQPAPLDMPRAEAYLVEEVGVLRLEDRYERMDLWTHRALLGRWTDDDEREFALFRLDMRPPAVDRTGTVTRRAFEDELVPVNRRRDDIRPLVDLLSPVEIAEQGRPLRQLPHGLRAANYWQTPTNLSAVVCAFLPEKSACWYLATWQLAENDDFYVQINVFEERFLERISRLRGLPETIAAALTPVRDERQTRASRRRDGLPSERELLRRDVRHDIALYERWHCTDSPEFSVVDNLGSRTFVVTLTNDLQKMRARYAAVLPTGISGSNTLCVARIYANRDEYLDAVDEEMSWTAAYWNARRRELVAHLPQNGEAELLRTMRHEAFHQYLSYATSMMSASPWLNEGYAQYFEDEDDGSWGCDLEPTPERIDLLAKSIPGLLGMDYEQFYDGSDEERRLKYRMAWSIVWFLEKGADKVRFRPFANLKRDYVASLLDTQDMRKATVAAFGNEDNLRLFVAEWKKFWKNR